MANIKARRLLSDLYKTGVEVRFSKEKPEGEIGPFLDDNGRRIPPRDDEVAMFVSPPDPVQREMAMRAAQAKRAASLVRAKRNEDSEEHLTIMAFLADMSQETLIDYVIIGDAATRRNEAEREVLALEEWKDMTAYQDAMREFLDKDPEELEGNEEYEALMELDEKFGRQVAEREVELAEAQREALRYVDRAHLERQALDKRSEMVGSQAFMAEYERQMTYYSVRDVDNHNELFFESPIELAAQPDPVREKINEALLPFISDGAEAKNSQGAAAGSESSVPPVKPETSESSIREEQIA